MEAFHVVAVHGDRCFDCETAVGQWWGNSKSTFIVQSSQTSPRPIFHDYFPNSACQHCSCDHLLCHTLPEAPQLQEMVPSTLCGHSYWLSLRPPVPGSLQCETKANVSLHRLDKCPPHVWGCRDAHIHKLAGEFRRGHCIPHLLSVSESVCLLDIEQVSSSVTPLLLELA